MWKYKNRTPLLGLGLGSQALYGTTNCEDNILGSFTMILQIKLQE